MIGFGVRRGMAFRLGAGENTAIAVNTFIAGLKESASHLDLHNAQVEIWCNEGDTKMTRKILTSH